MPTFEEHCAETEKQLGDRFEHVHKWLDEFSAIGPEHRKIRHNKRGILHCWDTWGRDAAKAANIHINQDLHSHIKKGNLWVPKGNNKNG